MKFPPTDLRFKCPQCGGSAFGSTLETADPLGPMRRSCHGDDARDGTAGCRFDWPDKDDWKHFLLDGARLTEKEYAALMAEIRRIPLAGFETGTWRMTKLHLGCGPLSIDGWENHDMDVDLRKPLPWADGSVDFVFTEHCVEHLFQREAWGFFEECWRILRPGGVLRTTVPDIVRLYPRLTPEYVRLVKERGWGDGSQRSGIKHVVFEHGHQSMWTPDLLMTVQTAIGFDCHVAPLHESAFPELRNLEQHWRQVGHEHNDIQSSAVEGVKRLASG